MFSTAMFMTSQAQASDNLIEGAKLCTKHLPRYEREYGIPTHLLSAIASTESGRYHEGLGLKVPWPWTINANGKGYFFNSKEEAIAAARHFRSHGVQSLDVGCMQVNIMHHPNAFHSLEDAFEPQTNIAYAASFLRDLYEEDSHSWKQAAADYHSKTPSLGKEYVGQVYNSWYNIIGKLREARMQVPESSVVAMNNLQSGPDIRRPAAPAAKSVKVVSTAPVIRPLPEQEGKKVAAYHAPRMNSIKIDSQESRRENGVIVVRPKIKVVDAPASQTASIEVTQPASLTLAQAKPAPETSDAKIIHVNAAASSADSKKTGPTFIFND